MKRTAYLTMVVISILLMVTSKANSCELTVLKSPGFCFSTVDFNYAYLDQSALVLTLPLLSTEQPSALPPNTDVLTLIAEIGKESLEEFIPQSIHATLAAINNLVHQKLDDNPISKQAILKTTAAADFRKTGSMSALPQDDDDNDDHFFTTAKINDVGKQAELERILDRGGCDTHTSVGICLRALFPPHAPLAVEEHYYGIDINKSFDTGAPTVVIDKSGVTVTTKPSKKHV